MANDILKYGVVTPCFIMNLPNGSIGGQENGIPKYFVEFEHNRTCEKACTFNLTITYAPDTFKPGEPETIHQLLLSSAGQTVYFKYGYYDSNGIPRLQNAQYCGRILEYTENYSNSALNYSIKGIANISVDDMDGEEIYMRSSTVTCKTRPSEHLLYHIYAHNWVWPDKLRERYDINIVTNDLPLDFIPEFRGTLTDCLMGKVNTDGTRSGGLVALSKTPGLVVNENYKNFSVSDELWAKYQEAMNATSHGNYNSLKDEAKEKFRDIITEVNERAYRPYKCYFDDISVSGKYGTLHYVPSYHKSATQSYVYEVGNNTRDSDVLSFSCTYDGAYAIANAPQTRGVSADIDADGNNTGSSCAMTGPSGISRNTYPTASGFNTEAWLSRNELNKTLIYPFNATMEVIGQLHCNQLMDVIKVTILVNGTAHPVLSGDYRILEITDRISSNGFTTSFSLVRENCPVSESEYENFVANNSNKALFTQYNIDKAKESEEAES